jgi:hypothetical protein
MIKKISAVNLKYLEEQADKLIAQGKASKDGDAIVIDVTELGYDKVLAKGKITKAYKISAPQFSASAIEKIEELAKALINSDVKLADVGIKPVFRLHPPRKGYEDIRLSVNEGGSLGYRGEEIKDLAKRML